MARIKYSAARSGDQDAGNMDWKNVIDGIARATLAVFILEVLAHLALAFSVAIAGLIYLDYLFAVLVLLTIVGYGVYYGRTYGAPTLIVATVILGVAGLGLTFIAVIGFPAFTSAVRTQLFWLGVLMIALTIPLGGYISQWGRRRWHDYATEFHFGHHSYDLAKDFGGCADGKGSLTEPTFSEPVVSAGGGSCAGAGVRVVWEKDSLVFRDGDNAVAVAGRGNIETTQGFEVLDGLCVVASTCRVDLNEPSTRVANDADASFHDFKTLDELKGNVAAASSHISSEAEAFLKEAMSKFNPEEKVESVSVGGFVNVEESSERKVVRVPGVYVYEGPEGKVVRVGGRVVKNEIRADGATTGFGGLYREGERPVTVTKNLSEGLSFVVMGPHWVAWKKDERVSA